MSYVARKARQVTGGAADVVSSAAAGIRKTTGAAFDVIADTAQKVGKTVEQIAKDPKMIAALAISVAYPGAGAALGQALGLGSTTGAIIGNTLINTALNGGDLKKGLQSAVANYAGVVVGGMAKEIVSGGSAGSFLASKAGLVDMAVKNAVTAAIKGQNVQATITATVMNAAVAESTSKIPGFSNLPPAARTAISSSISQSLQGKDLNVKAIFGDAAMSALVDYGLTQISGYTDLEPKYKALAATTVAAALRGKDLTANTINWALSEANKSLSQAIRDDKEQQAISEGWKNYPEKLRAQQNGYATAEEYHASLNPKPAEPAYVADTTEDTIAEQNEESQQQTETSGEQDGSPVATDEQPEEIEEVTPKHIDTEVEFLAPGDQDETPITAPEYQPTPDEIAQSEGWKNEAEKDWAATLGYKDALDYKTDVLAQNEGWENNQEKQTAISEGFVDAASYHLNLNDIEAGFDGTSDRNDALARGITDPTEWDLTKKDDEARSEGWSGLEQKNFAEGMGFTDYTSYNEHMLDEEAKAQGFVDREEKDRANQLGFDTPENWNQYLRDEDARYIGFDNEADKNQASELGFKDAESWNESQEEDRIIDFYNDQLGRDPTPEEMQTLKNYFGNAEDVEDFSDDRIINTIVQGIGSVDYVYGPDGTRYENAQDAIDHNVFDYTDTWEGPVYGSDGNRYESAEDAIANGVFDFSGVKPDDFVEPEETEDEGTTGETVYEGQVITPDGTVYDSVADALADGQFNFSQYTPPEDEGQTDEPINLEEDEEEVQPETSGPVWGPDGTEYASAEEAMAEGVFNYLLSPPEEQPEVPEQPEEPDVPGPEEPDTGPELPPVDEEEPAPEEPILWEEDEEEPGPEEPILWEEDEEEPAPEPVTCEPGFHDDGTGLCVPDEESDTQDEPVDCGVGFHLNEDGVCESDDLPEETVCEPGFHDDGTGLCVPDDDEVETDCGVGFHLNADGVCESDDATSGGGTGGGGTSGGTSSVRTRILQGLAKKALAAPAFQQQVQAPLAAAAETPEVLQQKSPLEQLGGKSIYPKRFRSVLQDYLEQIEPPEEFYSPAEGIEAPAPSQVLEQPSTFEQYREPDMATSTYFNYGQPQDLTELARMQQEQDLPLGEGLALPTGMAAGGMAAPLLMAKGGTGHGKNAHGALSIVEHSGKHRIDYRQGDAVTGAGDGQSDDIPAMLADGEFVIPADVVAALGNGSTKAGSDKLYEMMHSIRAHHRKAKPKDLPPPAKKSPLDYLKKGK